MSSVIIGTWHEKAERTISRCPSYYAADTETLRTHVGDYPARISLQGGYAIPMPYWLLVSIEATRVEGRLYSGFGGVNFASTDLPAGEVVTYGVQAYRHSIPELVAAGTLTLAPAFEFLNQGTAEVLEHIRASKWAAWSAWSEAEKAIA